MNREGYIDFEKFLVALSIVGIIFLFVGVPYVSNIQRKLLNTQYGTNYSFKEYLFASEIINDYMKIGKKQRLEIELKSSKAEADILFNETR